MTPVNATDNLASELFASLDECQRIPALDAHGTGGGLILTPEHITTLVAAATRLFPSLSPAIREGTIYAHLAPYIIQCPWRVLYDCQRQPMLENLAGRPASENSVLTGTPKKSKSRSRRAA